MTALTGGLGTPVSALDTTTGIEDARFSEEWAPFDQKVRLSKEAMLRAPTEAFQSALDAESLVPITGDADQRAEAMATAKWLQSEALNRNNSPEQAEPVVNLAYKLIESVESAALLRGDILLTRGRISQNLGKVQLALESYLEAHEVFLVYNEPRKQGIALQKVGDIYSDARDYERAISYYDQALDAYDVDKGFSMVTHNNRANALRGLNRYTESAKHYQQALDIADELDVAITKARILNNLALVQTLSGDLDAAEKTADLGLVQMQDGNQSGWEPFLWGVKADVAYFRGNLKEARKFIELTFAGQDLNTTTMAYRDFHEIAYRIYHALERDDVAFIHLSAFKRLEDEALSVAASTNAALMAARFDFTNQELKIEQLRLAQLQKDIEIASARARQRNLLLGALGVVGLLVSGFLLAGYISMRRSRNAIGLVNNRLNETNTQLEKANRAKTEFLATTSHEIRTPLNGILGMSQVILRDPSLDAAMRDKLQLVQSAGNAMKAIVDDLLDVAKIETGEVSTHLDVTDLHEVFDEACRLWQDSAVSKSLVFTSDFKSCPERVITDPQRLRQILFNLLSNAVKFTASGSVSLTAQCVGSDTEQQLIITVEDSGIGIPENEHENIFKPFHQVDGAMTRKYSGTGLGLSICKNFTEALGGELTVESVPGHGSVFKVILPVTLPDEVAVVSDEQYLAGPDEIEKLASARVLLLQEDFMEKMIFEAFFRDEVQSVDVVDTLDAFLVALSSHSYHFAAASVSDVSSVRRLAQCANNLNTVLLIWSDNQDVQELVPDSFLQSDTYSSEVILDVLDFAFTTKGGFLWKKNSHNSMWATV